MKPALRAFFVVLSCAGRLWADYVPDPIMFVHGRNSNFYGDWNEGSNKNYDYFRQYYPAGQRNGNCPAAS
jgi:hypothetical protein